jgi:hypothetical protein
VLNKKYKPPTVDLDKPISHENNYRLVLEKTRVENKKAR